MAARAKRGGEKPKASKEAADKHEAEERSAPGGHIIHQAITTEAEVELARSPSGLFWSGLAAGLSMGFSVITEGLLLAHLPDEPWRPLVSKLGYAVGFVVVVLARQQLFTENTLTPVLPLLERRDRKTAVAVLRLWVIVLAANLLGGLAVALALEHSGAFAPHARAVFAGIGTRALEPGFGTVLVRGVFAGWLIALMVWLLPFAETARVWVIVLLAYLVGLGEFSHVIAGSIATFTAAAAGQASWGAVVGGFVVPALIGNVIGGVALVAFLAHAQVSADE